MSVIARPDTPFPLPHQMAYHRPGSYDYSHHQPLNFAMPSLPSPTPPSLLNRSSSSGSSYSRRNASLIVRRESNTSMASSNMPSSPETLYAPPPTWLENSCSKSEMPLVLPSPEYNWVNEAITFTTDFHLVPAAPKRPPLVRRDTPRPTTTLRSLTSPLDEASCAKRRLTHLDGGHWILTKQ